MRSRSLYVNFRSSPAICIPPIARLEAADLETPHLVEMDNASHALTIQYGGRTNALLREHFARADV